LTREGELGRTNGIGEMEDFAARAARVPRAPADGDGDEMMIW
jgi:hypothetical protein